jgi:CubicO group peptidase (beta-lactamase class C family)
VQDGTVVWERGYGMADVARSIEVRPDTPFPIGGLTQALSAAILLEQCVETGHLDLDDKVQQWVPEFSDPVATIYDVLTHRTSTGKYQYAPSRFAQITGAIEACVRKTPQPIREVLAEGLFERLAMFDSVPSQDVADGSPDDRAIFSDAQLDRFDADLARMVKTYKVVSGTATVTSVAPASLTAADGAISTVRDLARFDAAFEKPVLLHRDTMAAMWTPALSASGAALPTGMGWFVQNYNGERVYWQFGLTRDAASSLIVKIPGKHLTLILLANSDGLSAPFALQEGDVNASLFARAFLRLFIG